MVCEAARYILPVLTSCRSLVAVMASVESANSRSV